MKSRPLVAWGIFFAILAIPTALLFVAGLYASNAEAARIRTRMATLRVDEAGKMRRELELSKLRGNEVLRELPEDATFEAATEALARAATVTHAAFLVKDGALTLPAPRDASAAAYRVETRIALERSLAADDSVQDVLIKRDLPPLGTAVQTMWSGALIATFRSFRGFTAGFALDRTILERGAENVLSPLVRLQQEASDDALGVPTLKGEVRTLIMPASSPTLNLNPNPEGTTLLSLGKRLTFRVVERAPHMTEAHAARAKLWFLTVFFGCLGTILTFAIVLFRRARNAQHLADLRTDFVAAVSHELRTPLASVRMFAELLEAGEVPEDERTEVEQTLAGETRRLHATLDRMLRFGALARGKLVVAKSKQRLAPILEEVARKRKVKVDVDPALEANVDGDLLRLAVDNLLSNAAKYAPAEDDDLHIVRAHHEGEELVIDVIDHGPGLSKKAKKKIFLPFERADQRLSRATEGSGVGLALVRGIARAHGGDASVASELGAGSTFTLRLPCN